MEACNGIKRAEANSDSAIESAEGRVKIAQAAVDTKPDTTAAVAALASARDALKQEQAFLAQVFESSGVIVPGSELVVVPELPAMLSLSMFPLGTVLSGEAWRVSFGDPIVEAYISAAQRTLLIPGDEATFTVESQEF